MWAMLRNGVDQVNSTSDIDWKTPVIFASKTVTLQSQFNKQKNHLSSMSFKILVLRRKVQEKVTCRTQLQTHVIDKHSIWTVRVCPVKLFSLFRSLYVYFETKPHFDSRPTSRPVSRPLWPVHPFSSLSSAPLRE